MTSKKLAAVRGMNDLLPADAPVWEWFEARVTRLGAQLRLPADPHADARAHRALRPRHRGSDRHRREGDVLLRGQAQRREPDAAPRVHRRHGARCGRAQPDLRGSEARVVDGPGVPPRATAAGTLPAVPPGQRRSARLRRPGHRCRAHRHAGAAVEDPRHRPGAPRDQLPRTGGRTRAPPRRPDHLLRVARRRCSTRTRSAGCTRIRCASSTPRTRPWPTSSRRRRRSPRTSANPPGPTSKGCSACWRWRVCRSR